MTEQEQINAAKNFAGEWRGRGNELSDTQYFWTELFRKVFDVKEPFRIIKFEQPVDIYGTIHYMDAIIPSTHVLIEQKSFGTDLTRATRQSDGEMLTPYEQAKRYADELEYSQRPRWIVACNFAEFRIYDLVAMEDFENYAPTVIKLEDLNYSYRNLNFLVDPDDDNFKPEVKLSRDAVQVMSEIYDVFKGYYRSAKIPKYRNELCKLCIRLVFCFYAEHSHIFGDNQFMDYVKQFNRKDINVALQKLFAILNQPVDERPDNLDDELKNFPYVDGDLFSGEISLPVTDSDFATKMLRALIPKDNNVTFEKLDWHLISPPIFGAMFESVINSGTRRAGGIHYTSIENIHKVIDPLVMDDLHAEFKSIMRKYKINRVAALQKFQDKLASLTFLDPACGSGNFLTETYLSLRRLENEVLRELLKLHCDLPDNPVKVSIYQFHGIEINDFAVAVAQVALFIAENQMLQKTEMVTGKDIAGLPLKNYANIVKANALRIDWNEVVSRDKLNYIIGNPPFVGYTYQSSDQKSDLLATTRLNSKKIDYVVSWYYKAAEFIHNTKIRVAFVSTNSICQGEQVAIVWRPLLQNVHIDFAHRPFKWESESEEMAAVHCVVVSISEKYRGKKYIFDGEKQILVKHINPYLIDAEDFFVDSRTKPLCDVPAMITGNRPADGGHLIIEADDYAFFIAMEPAAEKYIKRLIGSREFIHDAERYCLWLVDATPEEISAMPLVAERVEYCRLDRLQGAPDRQLLANTPHLFRETNNPNNALVVPCVSSENRRYIPMDFISSEFIVTDAVIILPESTMYHFGVLTSIVHMAWMRVVCGRLEISYRYSIQIVYNNFPWCDPTPAQKLAIESSAQNILDVRSRYDGWSFADLYDDNKMPSDLREAHAANDAAVMAAYNFRADMTESEIVAALMQMYSELTKRLE